MQEAMLIKNKPTGDKCWWFHLWVGLEIQTGNWQSRGQGDTWMWPTIRDSPSWLVYYDMVPSLWKSVPYVADIIIIVGPSHLHSLVFTQRNESLMFKQYFCPNMQIFMAALFRLIRHWKSSKHHLITKFIETLYRSIHPVNGILNSENRKWTIKPQKDLEGLKCET